MSKGLTLSEAAGHLERFLRDMSPYALTWGDLYRCSPDQAGLTRIRNIKQKLEANSHRCDYWLEKYHPTAMEEYMVGMLKAQTEKMISECSVRIEYISDTIEREKTIDQRLEDYVRRGSEPTQMDIPF